MEIIKNILPEYLWDTRCPYYMDPEFIVIHNTYNDAPARNERAYMPNNPYHVSFHFAVDDKEIIQCLPLNRNGWHAGDGANGRGNRKGIAIEICYSLSGGQRFLDAEKLAAKLTAKLLKDYGWGIEKVKKHQDFMDKYCPHRTLDLGWGRFLDIVRDELNGVKLGWRSNDVGWWYVTGKDSYFKNCWKNIEGVWYFFGNDGYAYQNKFYEYCGNLYYFDNSCYMVSNQWKKINGKWYYFDDTGIAFKNKWLMYKDEWYYFDENCYMVHDRFLTLGNETFYLNNWGVCDLNYVREIDGKMYAFDDRGVLIKDKVISSSGVIE